MPVDSLAKNVGQLNMFGIADYAKKRKLAQEREVAAARPVASAGSMNRIASEGEERIRKF